MNERDQIVEIINKFPKHYSNMIRNNPLLWDWVINNTDSSKTNYAEMIYLSLNPNADICKNNNLKKFSGIKSGYKFCAKTGMCQCAKEAVSKKITESKAKRTINDIEQENIKRKKTTFERYRVSNVGQTTNAKTAHKNFYSSKDNVDLVTNKIKNTKLERHGTAGYNNRELARKTTELKYGYSHHALPVSIEKNPMLAKLVDKDKLLELYNNYSIEEIANINQVHIQTVYRYLGLHGIKDPYRSVFETEIVNFLNSMGIVNIITNTRKLIDKEIDIYLPDFKLAIEYNGEYWHHSQISYIDRLYHYNKFKKCEEQGIKLLTIFGESWKTKKDIWKAKITSLLGKTNTRVYARKTNVVALTNNETKDILNQHHIQGHCNSQYSYGLKFNDELVAVMTFSKSRTGIGKNRGEDSYELVRYVTNCNVVGGASKLLKHFIKIHSPKTIISYSDNRYSTGNMYELLGFQLESENKTNYWYYDPKIKKSFHRYKFAKHVLVKMGYDCNKTEKEITTEMGLLRIYDCGTRTWKLKIA